MRLKSAPESIEGNLPEEERANNRQDQTINNQKYCFRDEEYYASKECDMGDIQVPLLSVGNWGGILLHLRGNTEGYVYAGSEQKWLRVITGRHDLPFYYDQEVDIHFSFLDAFLKDEDDAGWTTDHVPPVDLVLRKGDVGFNNLKAESTNPRRTENEWPIARTQWTKWYLTPHMTLTADVRQAQEASTKRQKLTYEAPGTLDNHQLIQFPPIPSMKRRKSPAISWHVLPSALPR